MNQIKVLDHGLVRLVDSMGSDLSIVRAARVSYDAAWRAGEDKGSDARLINYLWKNGHTSPFESVTFTFEVKAPIFVLRQWMRHRTWSFNEVSARYTELPNEMYLPDVFRKQSKSNKQGSDGELDSRANKRVHDSFYVAMDILSGVYNMAIDDGVARELARIILPVATYSHMFCTVDLLNLLKFITLRSHNHAQYEIQVYADAMLKLIEPIVPEAVKAWKKSSGDWAKYQEWLTTNKG
jgi:thymidylate synthase (FAD)